MSVTLSRRDAEALGIEESIELVHTQLGVVWVKAHSIPYKHKCKSHVWSLWVETTELEVDGPDGPSLFAEEIPGRRCACVMCGKIRIENL